MPDLLNISKLFYIKMIKIIFIDFAKKQNQQIKSKKLAKKKYIRDIMNFNQIRKYKFGLFTFFIWYNNFKDCSENISFQIDRILKKSTKKLFGEETDGMIKNLRLRDFSGRIFSYKILFSLTFLRFPLEKVFSVRKLLEFIFIKKKPKF